MSKIHHAKEYWAIRISPAVRRTLAMAAPQPHGGGDEGRDIRNTAKGSQPIIGEIDMLRQTAEDVENMLTALTVVVHKRREGIVEQQEQHHLDDFEYARRVLVAGELDLRKLGMYEKVERAIKESERLIQAVQFDAAEVVLLNTAGELMKKSGTYDRMAAEYSQYRNEDNEDP